MTISLSPSFSAFGPAGRSIANNATVVINGVTWTANNWNQAPHPTAYSLLMSSTTLARFQAINGQNDPDFDGGNVIRTMLVNGAGFPYFTPVTFSATINWALNTPYPTVNVFNVLMQLHGGIEGSGRSPPFSIDILPNGTGGEKMQFGWNYQTPNGPFTFANLGSIPFSRNTNYAVQITYVDGHGYNLGSVVVVVNGVTVVNFSGVTGHALAVTNSNPSFGYYGGVVSGVPVTQNNVASIDNPTFSIGTTPTVPFTWLDGTLGAPIVATGPQYPTLLNGYTKVPNWNVAGVAYPVGIPDSSFPLKNPLTSVPAGCSVAGTTLTVNAIDVYLDGYDFSVSGGVNIVCAQNRLSIINCNFDGVNYRSLTNGVINFSGVDLTLRYCKVSGGFTASGAISSPLGLIYCANGNRGALSFQYNWFLNCAHTVLRLGSATPLNCQYNLFDNINVGSGGSTAYVTWNSGNVEVLYLLWQFNTSRQISTGLGATVGTTFFDTNAANQEFFSLICQYNTAVAPGATAGQTMSYIFEGNPTSAKIGSLSILGSNYADYRGALGMFYPNTWVATPQLTITPNYNMVTGAVVDPNALPGFYAASASNTPPGNDSNPGTIAAPFLTGDKLIATLNASTTINNGYVRSGIVNTGTMALGAGKSLLGYPGDPPLSATIHCTTPNLGNSNIAGITIKGLAFTLTGSGAILLFNDCANLKVQGCQATCAANQNFIQFFRPRAGLRIQGNTITASTIGATAGTGIFPINIIINATIACNDWIINSNTISGGTFAIQIQQQGASGIWTNVHVDWNTCTGWGNNTSTIGNEGISFVGSANASSANNTCWGNTLTQGSSVGSGIEVGTAGCTYANNAITASFGLSISTAPNSLFQNNTVTYTSNAFSNGGSYSATGIDIAANTLNGSTITGCVGPSCVLSPVPTATGVPANTPSAPYVG